MSTFRPTRAKECEFNFDDKFVYTLPVDETTLQRVLKIAKVQAEHLQTIHEDDADVFDKVFNSSLDALDEIFGEGAGADIMSIYENPTLFDVVEVVNYIANEFTSKYSEFLNACKKAGVVPPSVRGRR